MSESLHPTQALLTQVTWVRALALELVRDGGEAEDLTQETILLALEHPPRESGALRGFLRSVLHNVWRQRARGESRRREREERVARAEAVPATDELVEHLALHRRVVEAVQALEEPYRRALLLRYFDGLPPRAIARRLELPIRTVNTHLQRGLERLRARFDAESENERSRWARAFVAWIGSVPWISTDPEPRAALTARTWVKLALPLGALALLFWSRLSAPREATPGPAAENARAEQGSDIGAALASAQAARARVPAAAPAARLAGRVHTSAGEPVAGAEVEVLYRPAASFVVRTGAFAHASSALGATSTDASGRFELALECPRTWQPWRVVVRARGFGTEIRDDVFGDGPLDVELRRAGRFEFTLRVGDDEQPCAGTRFVLDRQGLRDPVFEGATDAEGRVAIEALAPGLYTVEATPPAAERVVVLDLVLRAGESVARTLRTQAGASLAGEVRSARDGRPIAGARVRAAPDRETRADEAGRFRFDGLYANRPRVDLTAEAIGFAPLARALDRRELAPEGLVLELEPEGRARGSLRAADGAPVAGAWIVADSSEARSAADGSFVLDGLVPGTRPLVFVRAEGRAPLVALLPYEVLAGELALGEVRLAAAASVAGRVRTRAGTPLSGAWVQLEALDELATLGTPARESETRAHESAAEKTVMIVSASASSPSPSPAPSSALSAEPAEVPEVDASPFRDRSVHTDAQGRFRVLDLAPGRYRVASRAPGQCSAPELELELAAGEARDGIELVHADGARIAGRVVGFEDESIPGAWLILSAVERAEGGAAHLSELDGGFELDGLAAGVYDLEVSFHGSIGSGAEARSYARAFVRGLRPPVRDLEVRLPRDLFVEGELRDEDDRPLVDLYVDSLDDAGRRDTAETDRDGRFKVGAAEGTRVILRVAGRVVRGAGDAERARSLPRWSGELRDVVAGSRGVVLRATRAP